MALSKVETHRTKDLQEYAENNLGIKKRFTIDILNDMEKMNMIEKSKVKGMRKLQGWRVREELAIPSNDMWTTSVDEKGNQVYDKITQKQLTKELQVMIKGYRKIVADKKSILYENDFIFPIYHFRNVVLCLKWISRLTLAIKSGLFLDNRNKPTWARENIKLFEDFMNKNLSNVAIHYENNDDKYNVFLVTVMNYFEGLNPLEDIMYDPKTNLVFSSAD